MALTLRKHWLATLAALAVAAILVIQLAIPFVSAMTEKERRGINEIPGVTEKAVSLTIDDGPDPRFTPAILDTLKAKGAKATFFVVGTAAEKHPELIRRILAEGHEIANHTYTHPHFDKITPAQAREEIAQAKRVLAKFGVDAQWVRAPRGATTGATAQVLRNSGMRAAGWTIGVENNKPKGPEGRADRVMDAMFPGAIILAHDGRLDRSPTVATIPVLLDKLHDEGYRVVTLSQLAAMGH
ncbi:peptidoglycan/xylan/chitin deacetylase (PgdA/CDA1 family) [Arcanobacterium wilhelmae]|uniref:Peptidoglycan/xylan/chitin deacetylase (PgdA/CDA1 family) n=1 Tax=Arcanobacterium wilhelmae TaxID=1803177 RepID=A0ABT9NAD9_9ACTO|nr:polysaccharide deacetylase family protein [Arcanobacterium wilhelmae]MDP9800460.1 peptidoglycan/xylan/chitin deacetylase (PgdA/CDA1 family) [Arcanobacterium wilhelmae]WFN89880.1 polysaccharide deacetylase family protein [Arcanobacterium wilhelmae]